MCVRLAAREIRSSDRRRPASVPLRSMSSRSGRVYVGRDMLVGMKAGAASEGYRA